MEYYQKIRNIREDMDFKQYQFARIIRVLPKTYNLYENGVRSIPYPVLSRILNRLNLSLDYILGLSDKRTYRNLKRIHVDVLAKNFQHYRKRMGLSQIEMASLLNCCQQTISSYESGKLKVPIEVLQKFCQITQISADTIAGRTKEIRILKKIPSMN